MKIEDLKITKEEMERLIGQQGNEVLQVLNMQGWKLIENSLILSKQKAALKRRQVMDKQSTRENSIYYSGIEDGIEIVKEDIYEIVNSALRMKQAQELERDLKEDLR